MTNFEEAKKGVNTGRNTFTKTHLVFTIPLLVMPTIVGISYVLKIDICYYIIQNYAKPVLYSESADDSVSNPGLGS